MKVGENGVAGGTYVLVEEAQSWPIEEICEGMGVLSRCEKTGETKYCEVLRTYEREARLFELRYVNANGREAEILCTAAHPFWVAGEGRVSAAQLIQGHSLLVADKDLVARPMKHASAHLTQAELDALEQPKLSLALVQSVVDTGRDRLVYNLEVDEFNTYFAGDDGVWVHGANGDEKHG